MNPSRQAPPSEPEGSSDPIGAIEAALVAMRREQGRRRLQRRAERSGAGFGARGDESAVSDVEGHGHPHGGQGNAHRGWGRGHGEPHGHHGGMHGGHHGGGHGALAHAASFRLLDALEASDRPSSVSELAEAIGVDQPRASRLVQGAVDAGHVRREADPSDARRSALVLTAAGREVLASARANRRSAVEAALAGFSEQETAEFAQLLARFVAAWPRD